MNPMRVSSSHRQVHRCLIVLFLLCSSAYSQPSAPRTVLDYYLLLPEKYFEANKEQRVKWMLDPKRGAVVDVKNGYLFAPGDGAQTSIWVCLLTRRHRRPLVAVKWHESDSDKYTHVAFYEYRRGSLVAVKEKSLVPQRNQWIHSRCATGRN